MKKTILSFCFALALSVADGQSVFPDWISNYTSPAIQWYGNGIVTDPSGSCYVLCNTIDTVVWPTHPNGAYLIKYDPNGQMQWEVFLGVDYSFTASKLLVAKDGFIYVGKRGLSALEVSRVSQQGNIMWSNAYISCDIVSDMVSDDSCNVYIIGTHNLDSTLIAKIDSSGNHIWTTSYNYLTGPYDRASSLTVDREGRVYAAVYSSTGSSQYCSAITRYTNTGQQEWSTRICPTGFGIIPTLIRIYKDTMLIVVGQNISTQGESDIFLQRLDTSGNIIWTRYFDTDSAMGFPYLRRDTPKSMIITRSGKIAIVADGADSGMPMWVNLFYDQNGQLIWWRSDFPSYADTRSVVEDPDGNLIFGGSTVVGGQNVVAASKYDTTGVRNWIMSYAPLSYGHASLGYATVDSAGNVFCTGMSWTTDTALFFTMKFSYMVSVADNGSPATISIYPNPANEVVTFQFSESNESRRIIIYDQFGQIVVTQTALGTDERVHTTLLSSGVYFYQIIEENLSTVSGKFVIQKL